MSAKNLSDVAQDAANTIRKFLREHGVNERMFDQLLDQLRGDFAQSSTPDHEQHFQILQMINVEAEAIVGSMSALSSLTKGQLSAYCLVHGAGCDYHEAARVCAENCEAVRSLVRRARRRLAG